MEGESVSEIKSGEDVTQPDSASNSRGAQFRLVSDSTRDGSVAFEKGLSSFRSHSVNDALGAFDAAVSAEPTNAMYQYYRALALFDLNSTAAAGEALERALELEREQPIANWGKRMERVQGRGRVWIENARAAGLTR